MKKIIMLISALFMCFVSTSAFTAHTQMQQQPTSKVGKQSSDFYFFWSYDCPHCVAAHPFVNKLKSEFPGLRVHSYEISKNPANYQRLTQFARKHGRDTSFVPVFFTCKRMIVGYSGESSRREIREAIKECYRK